MCCRERNRCGSLTQPTILKPALALKQPAVGQLIRELRQLAELTQEQFAAILGVTYSTINRWENGHMQPSPLALRQVRSATEPEVLVRAIASLCGRTGGTGA